MPKRQIFTKIEDKIGIVDQNILINNGNISAFYILSSVNYSILNEEGTNIVVSSLESMIKSLGIKYPKLEFSIFKINKPTSAFDIENNLIETVRMWDPSYKGVPPIFKDHIKKANDDYCILQVSIDSTSIGDVESTTTKDLIVDIFNKLSNGLFTANKVNYDFSRIRSIEHGYYDIIMNYGVRCSRELTFYTYISQMYPSYEISYNNNSYVTNNIAPILGFVNQQISSKFGYMELENYGVEVLGYQAEKTYASMITINTFPESIDSDNFNMALPGLKVNVRLLPKSKAQTEIKRTRADLEYEMETAEAAGARDTQLLEEQIELSNEALNKLNNKNLLCEMNVSMLILGRTLEELKTNRQKIILSLADSGMIAGISLDQGEEFIHSIVNSKPKKYPHLADLRVPLSFQLNNCPIVGDSDSRFAAPKIGETI